MNQMGDVRPIATGNTLRRTVIKVALDPLALVGPEINTTSLDRAGYFNPHMQKSYLLIK